MTNYSETMIIMWYALVFLAFIVHPMLLVCAKRVSTTTWAMLVVYQGATAYFGYMLSKI